MLASERGPVLIPHCRPLASGEGHPSTPAHGNDDRAIPQELVRYIHEMREARGSQVQGQPKQHTRRPSQKNKTKRQTHTVAYFDFSASHTVDVYVTMEHTT
jgi:hypothetical protein